MKKIIYWIEKGENGMEVSKEQYLLFKQMLEKNDYIVSLHAVDKKYEHIIYRKGDECYCLLWYVK